LIFNSRQFNKDLTAGNSAVDNLTVDDSKVDDSTVGEMTRRRVATVENWTKCLRVSYSTGSSERRRGHKQTTHLNPAQTEVLITWFGHNNKDDDGVATFALDCEKIRRQLKEETSRAWLFSNVFSAIF
jgi:hypothetical protein